ncbi:MAG: hypothetical protein Q9M82_05615 [Mariprofundus sp.]|nr:hypothetical protein [Mariprofundus sp.]
MSDAECSIKLAIQTTDVIIRAMFSLKIELMQRLRFAVAILAVIGSMWALVDLHQHKDGLHQAGACTVCSLENAAGNGTMTLVMLSLSSPAIVSDAQDIQAERLCLPVTNIITPIRAPPYA